MERGGDRGRSRDAALGDLDLDQLLREVLARVHGVVDEQARVQHLLDAVVAITSEISLDGVLARILSTARSLVGARYAALGVLSEGPDRRMRAFVHEGMDDELVARIGAGPTGDGLLGVLVDDPRPVRLSELSAHPAAHGFPEHHPHMASFLGVPVHARGRVFGNLYLTEKEDGKDFTEQDESVVVALAAAAGVAIEHAELYEDASRREAWLAATAELISLLADDISTDLAMQLVAERARTLSGADVAWVVTGRDPEGLHLEVVSGARADVSSMRALPMEESLASIVVRTGEAIAVEDVAADPRAVDPSTIPGWPRLGPVMVLPLRSSKGVEGVLSLGWTPDHLEHFHRVDPALPTSFAEQATLALQVARVRDTRQRVSLLEERDRIGRDLHDLVIQRLFAVGLELQSTAHLSADDRVTERLRRSIDDIDDTIKDIRRTIFALGSIDKATDVQSEVENLVRRAGAVMKMRPRLRIDGPLRTAVTADLAPDLLAVLSEALTNVGRHADAASVDVHISVGADTIEVGVTDDGRGMALDVLESGLRNMRSRAERHGGELVVAPAAGGGTSLTWRVPLGW